MNKRRGLLLVGTMILGSLVVASTVDSFSNGIDRSKGLTDKGCICHGPNTKDDGVDNGAVRLLFRIDNMTGQFNPNQVYNLTVGASDSDVPANATSNKGGFNLKVNIGKLAAASGWDDKVQIVTDTEATHTAAGDKNGRTFNLTWTAPGAEGEPAIFTLFVNTVNGDTLQNADDHWNRGTFVFLNKDGKLGAAGHGVNPEEIGVKWLAHWVGIVSFLAVMGTLLIYYFVLKYGESIHTTDHRDRKEK